MQRIKLTSGNGDVVIVLADNNTETLPGIFTVNTIGKKVKFSPGNLYWEDGKLKFEKHQYDFPTMWNPNHVGHFYWDKNILVARAKRYAPENPGRNDLFFAANCGAICGYTVLSQNEWYYLFQHALVKNSSDRYAFGIDGKICAILKPDNFHGTVADNYTAEEWAIAEASGLVALSFAGYRKGLNFEHKDIVGSYWSSNPAGFDDNGAVYASVLAAESSIEPYFRDFAFPVRLVSVQ